MWQPLLAACVTLPLVGPSALPARVEGDYVEARTADVYTGPCFWNAEVFLTGHQAVMAWRVRRGTWEGVDLSGLSVAAAVRGTTTFGADDPAGARAVVIVDETATPRQREALVSLARELGGVRLARIVEVRPARMSVTVEGLDEQAGESSHHDGSMPAAPLGSFWAAGEAEILTRPLDDGDHLCGNETVAYAPLSSGTQVLPAYTLANVFKGDGLDTRWDDRNCRGSFVGRFAR